MDAAPDTRWLVRLVGDSGDLLELADLLEGSDPGIVVLKGRGDPEYYVAWSGISPDASADEVRECAERMVDAIAVPARLALDVPAGIRWGNALARVHASGRKDAFVYIADAIRGSGRAHVAGVASGHDIVSGPGPEQPVLDLARLALTDDEVAEAMRFLRSPVTWFGLNDAIELVGRTSGGIVARGWTSASQLGLFTGSANTDPDGRHRASVLRRPKYPMSLREAEAFVGGVVQQWARARLGA